MTSTDSRIGTWGVVIGTARGAAHHLSGLPNQDAVAHRPGPGGAVTVAIADGHGHSRHFRSADGSALAVDIACQVASRMAAELTGAGDAGGTADAGRAVDAGGAADAGRAVDAGGTAEAEGTAEADGVTDADEAAVLVADMVRDIVAEWRAGVAEHLAGQPYTAEQQAALDLAGDGPEVPYGATLLMAVIAGSWLVCAQIGDGDMLGVGPDGGVFYPVADDDRLDGHRTTSLCQPDAADSFRTGAYDLREVPIAALLLATDGYGNAQAEEPWQPGVGRDLAEFAASHDRAWFEQQVPDWAQRCASSGGSGDDTTIALLLHPGAGPEIPAEAEGELLTWTD
jgi:Protein phosphatase 2C